MLPATATSKPVGLRPAGQDEALKVTGIIAAGGSGQRLGIAGGKQLLEIAGRPVAAWSIDALASAELIDDIVVVCDPERVEEYAQTISKSLQTEKPLTFVAGGDTREASVMAGLIAAEGADIVAVHDGARPLLEPAHADQTIAALIDGCSEHLWGTVLGYPAVDTLKQVTTTAICEDGIVDTPPRSMYWHAQTPQVFWRVELASCYDSAKQEGWQGTDDASYVEHQGGILKMLQGSRNNIKITSPEDVVFAEVLLAQQKL
jgi:2-C-methyl-D-erythritol 4-phosphate cytidylyltransferase